MKTFSAPYLKRESIHMISTTISENETSGHCLMANCNGGDYCITCTPCKMP